MVRRTIPAPSSRQLPANVADLQAQRVVKRTVTLLDEVEQALLAIYDDENFRKYRDALEPEETVEGSIFADDICAAQEICKKAAEMGLSQIEGADLTTISMKLRGAERRFNASRKQRAKAATAAE